MRSYNMDTNLQDPRGKIRCLQQAEEEERKIQNSKKISSEVIYMRRLKKAIERMNDRLDEMERGKKQ